MSDAEQAMLALMRANEEQRLLIVELMAERDAFQREAAWRDSEQRREAAEWAKEGATLRAEVERLQRITRMLAGFAETAATLDWNEDNNVTWAAVVAAEARAALEPKP